MYRYANIFTKEVFYMKKNADILLAVSSLPGRHGIGDFGHVAFEFVDWLKDNHYSIWQVLPLNPVGPGNSPYMSTCSEAIETRYISLDLLSELGLIDNVEPFLEDSTSTDYYKVGQFKDDKLWTAFQNFKNKKGKVDYYRFKKEHDWLDSFAVYILFHNRHNQRPWNEWEQDEIHYYDNGCKYEFSSFDLEQMEFTRFKQYIAYKQWFRLWNYAKKKGIKIIADCPFYVGIDSTDCWLHKEQFHFDEKYNPTIVSGVPPDYFSEDGQLWGTPIYDFDKMKEDNYSFLVDRIGRLASTCDMLRLDHFRAWDTYCIIPGEDVNARRGKWEVGPRNSFFDALYKKYPSIDLIAEDLGDLFPSVIELKDHYHLPGMFVVEFTIFDDNARSNDNMLVYTGTHDNQTLLGWLNELDEDGLNKLKSRFGCNDKTDLAIKILEYSFSLSSKFTIVPLQDILLLDETARFNVPGTVGSPNWEWKLCDFSWKNKIKFKL